MIEYVVMECSYCGRLVERAKGQKKATCYPCKMEHLKANDIRRRALRKRV